MERVAKEPAAPLYNEIFHIPPSTYKWHSNQNAQKIEDHVENGDGGCSHQHSSRFHLEVLKLGIFYLRNQFNLITFT